MKKVFIFFALILILSSCGVQNQITPNEKTKSDSFNLADYNQQAQTEMSEWFNTWSEAYGNFSLADFILIGTNKVEYYAEDNYVDYPSSDESGLAHIVKLKSPDNKNMILIYYGGDPESGVGIVDLAANWEKHFANLQCGTSCVFTDGFWLDNDRFIVANNSYVFPADADEKGKYGLYYHMPDIFLVDLKKNVIDYYEMPEPFLSKSSASFSDNIFIMHGYDYTIYNPADSEFIKKGTLATADYFNTASDITSLDSNLNIQYYLKDQEIIYLTSGYDDMLDNPCINHDKTCDTIIYKKSEGKVTDEELFRTYFLNPTDWLINQERGLIIVSEIDWNTKSPDYKKILVKKIDLNTKAISTLYEKSTDEMRCGALSYSANNENVYLPCLENEYNGKSPKLGVLKINLNNEKYDLIALDNYKYFDLNRVSPDGNYLAVVKFDQNHEVWLYNLNTKEKVKVILLDELLNIRLVWSADSQKLAISLRNRGLMAYDLTTKTLIKLADQGYPLFWTKSGLYYEIYDQKYQYWLLNNNQVKFPQNDIWGDEHPNRINGILFF